LTIANISTTLLLQHIFSGKGGLLWLGQCIDDAKKAIPGIGAQIVQIGLHQIMRNGKEKIGHLVVNCVTSVEDLKKIDNVNVNNNMIRS